jgi:DNA (cytosine-5)-methyltransferase 1
VRRFTPNEVERVQGFPDDWTLPRHLNGLGADKIDSLRYHAVGNAVTPQVGEWLGHRLVRVLTERLLQPLQSTLKRRGNALAAAGD